MAIENAKSVEHGVLVKKILVASKYLTIKEQRYVTKLGKQKSVSQAELYALSDLARRVDAKEFSSDERPAPLARKQALPDTNPESQEAKNESLSKAPAKGKNPNASEKNAGQTSAEKVDVTGDEGKAKD